MCGSGAMAGCASTNAQSHKWRYWTRAEGLPSDQISASAFAGGDVIVGTRCDGLAIGSRDEDFKTWRIVAGPTVPSARERGSGLPSALINGLLSTREGRIYAGTSGGLAWSDDDGASWHYVRGREWIEKSRDLWRDPAHPQPRGQAQVLAAPAASEADEETGGFEPLREDYVSCLAEDARGRLLIGHWAAGWEMREPSGQRIVARAEAPDYVRAFLPSDEGLLIASYGSGLMRAVLPPELQSKPASTSGAKLKALPSGILFELPKFPAPARPPSLRQLQELKRKVNGFQDAATAGYAAYLGEDWETRGDRGTLWVGGATGASTRFCARPRRPRITLCLGTPTTRSRA